MEANNAKGFFKKKRVNLKLIDCTKQQCPVDGFPHIVVKRGTRKNEIPGYVPWSEIVSAVS